MEELNEEMKKVFSNLNDNNKNVITMVAKGMEIAQEETNEKAN